MVHCSACVHGWIKTDLSSPLRGKLALSKKFKFKLSRRLCTGMCRVSHPVDLIVRSPMRLDLANHRRRGQHVEMFHPIDMGGHDFTAGVLDEFDVVVVGNVGHNENPAPWPVELLVGEFRVGGEMDQDLVAHRERRFGGQGKLQSLL